MAIDVASAVRELAELQSRGVCYTTTSIVGGYQRTTFSSSKYIIHATENDVAGVPSLEFRSYGSKTIEPMANGVTLVDDIEVVHTVHADLADLIRNFLDGTSYDWRKVYRDTGYILRLRDESNLSRANNCLVIDLIRKAPFKKSEANGLTHLHKNAAPVVRDFAKMVSAMYADGIISIQSDEQGHTITTTDGYWFVLDDDAVLVCKLDGLVFKVIYNLGCIDDNQMYDGAVRYVNDSSTATKGYLEPDIRLAIGNRCLVCTTSALANGQ